MNKLVEQIWLVYDGECPFCSSYVKFVRLQDSFGRLHLIDARQGGELVNSVIKQGFDLNEGMVLVYQNRFYHGADCINILALMSTRSGFFNRINAAIFRNATVSNLLYPILRVGRNTTLKILGKKKFNS